MSRSNPYTNMRFFRPADCEAVFVRACACARMRMGSEPRGSSVGAAFNHRVGYVWWDFRGEGAEN